MQNEQKTNQNLIKWVFRIGLILVDIFIVNFSYYLALLLRFYVNHQFNPEAVPYIPLFYRFAPGYTVCCIIVFAFFKLYRLVSTYWYLFRKVGWIDKVAWLSW